MVVSSVLMSMGMMMLPPTTISTPFKILLFVMADGWNLIIGNLMMTFNNKGGTDIWILVQLLILQGRQYDIVKQLFLYFLFQ